MSIMFSCFFFLMIRRPPRSTRTDTLSLHDALPIYRLGDHQLALLDILHHPFDRPSGIDEVDTGIGRHLLPVGAIEALEMRDEGAGRSEEHTSELQSLMRISYAVFCLKKKKKQKMQHNSSNVSRQSSPIS